MLKEAKRLVLVVGGSKEDLSCSLYHGICKLQSINDPDYGPSDPEFGPKIQKPRYGCLPKIRPTPRTREMVVNYRIGFGRCDLKWKLGLRRGLFWDRGLIRDCWVHYKDH